MTITARDERAAGRDTERAEPSGRVRIELSRALELVGLSSFAFARPVLDSFGRSPETFIARGASAGQIVLFAVLVVVVPAGAAVAVGLATNLLGGPRRGVAHVLLVALLAGVGAWRLAQDLTGWPGTATKVQLSGLLAFVAVGWLRWRVDTVRTFLRLAGATALVFPLQFLVASPTAALVTGDRPGIDHDVARSVAADLGSDPAPVVVVVLDAFPTAGLLDGEGGIDEDLFPNIAALAGTSTWYRNHSTVSAFTGEAVPAILTGRYPDPAGTPEVPDDENLFTLLGGSYDLRVAEQVTDLCPDEACPERVSAGLGRMLADAADLWTGGTGGGQAGDLSLPAALHDERYAEADRWIETLDGSARGRPDLTFLHLVLPHGPWVLLDDGTPYDSSRVPYGWFGHGWSDTGIGIPVARQRFLLQARAADRLVGQLMDELRAEGTFDESLVVLTADHGEAFTPGEPSRLLSEGNATELLWTPLVVKSPGQSEGRVDDSNVMSIDVVPTIADELGVELPWEVDGMPAPEAAGGRDPDVKYVDADDKLLWQPEGDEPRIEVDAEARLAELVGVRAAEWDGPDAAWKRTRYGDLFRRDVDGLRVGDPLDDTITLQTVPDLDGVDPDEPLALDVVGRTPLPEGAVVAYALNGTIGAVVETEPPTRDDATSTAHGLVPPDLFVRGDNDLTAYRVTGPPDDPLLRPLALADDG